MSLAAVLAATLGFAMPAQAPDQAMPAQAPGQSAVVWAAGDGADGSAAAKRMAARIAADRPDRFLYLGDVYPDGTAADFRRNYATTYGRLDRIAEPTAGNHEWANRNSGYRPYWRRAKGRPQRDYYSFRLAGWELINLNTEIPHGPGSRQLAWLRGRLGARSTTCRLAFFHVPRFAARGLHGDNAGVAPIWNMLRGDARLVLNGHEHSLQRFRRRDGMTQFISAAGGSILYRLRGRDRRLAFGRSGVTGALRMVLEPGRATLEFRSAGGRVLDRSRVTCRP